MRYLEGHTGLVQAVAFSPEGRLATGGADGEVCLWDVARSRLARSLRRVPGNEWVGALSFSPKEEQLAIGYHDGRLDLWDLAQASPGAALLEDQGRLTSLCFSPRGRELYLGSYLGGAIVSLGSAPQPRAFRDPNGLVYAVRVSPNGKSFATGGTSRHVFLRQAPGGQELLRLTHNDREGCWSLAYSPNGRTLAVALGGGLQLWDVEAGALRGTRRDHRAVVSAVAFSPDGGRLLTAGWDGIVRLYAFDQGTGSVVRQLGEYDWKIGKLFDVALSADGSLAAAGGDQAPHLVVWDVE